ncbi:MAG: hypothetical protein K2G69_08790, partial [Muribaculaceae bacterium]|nr:hypothetical protein [Muribaculaceae bacterium]
GNYNTVGNYFPFSYESESISSEELYVIFNYVDSNGVVHTISNDAYEGGVTPTTINPKNAHGWRVNGAKYDNLYDASHSNIAGNNPTKNNYYWQVNSPSSSNPSVYCYTEDPAGNSQGGDFGGGTEKKYRIIWPKEWGGIYRYDIYFYDCTPATLDGWKKQNDVYGNEHYYVFTSTVAPKVNFKLCSDTNGSNAKEYTNISSFGYNSSTGYYEYKIENF